MRTADGLHLFAPAGLLRSINNIGSAALHSDSRKSDAPVDRSGIGLPIAKNSLITDHRLLGAGHALECS